MQDVDLSELPDAAALALWALIGGADKIMVCSTIEQYSRLILCVNGKAMSPTHVKLKDLHSADTRAFTFRSAEAEKP